MKILTVRFISALACSAAWVAFAAFGSSPVRSALSAEVDAAWSSPGFEAAVAEHPARITEWDDIGRASVDLSDPLHSAPLEPWFAQLASDDSVLADDSLWLAATPEAGSDESIWSWLYSLASESEQVPALADPADLPRADSARQPLPSAAATATDPAQTETYALMLAALGALGFVARRRSD